jgi:excisionase family DNA binding protein
LTAFLKNFILSIMSKETKLLSVIEAAEKLGVSRWRVNQFIDKGRLPAQKVGRSYVILESDLQLVENRQTGRPPKDKDEK